MAAARRRTQLMSRPRRGLRPNQAGVSRSGPGWSWSCPRLLPHRPVRPWQRSPARAAARPQWPARTHGNARNRLVGRADPEPNRAYRPAALRYLYHPFGVHGPGYLREGLGGGGHAGRAVERHPMGHPAHPQPRRRESQRAWWGGHPITPDLGGQRLDRHQGHGRAYRRVRARLSGRWPTSQQSRYGLLNGRLFCIFIHSHLWSECPHLVDMRVIVRHQGRGAPRLDHLHDQALCGPKGKGDLPSPA